MTVIVFGALVWQVIDFLRELTNFKQQRSAIVTQATAWGGGVLLVLLGAHAAATKALILPGSDIALGKLDLGSIILVGMIVASVASTGVDLKQAFDRTDSAAKPPLIPAAAAALPASPPTATPTPAKATTTPRRLRKAAAGHPPST